jgi:hypothetical protein
MAQCGRKVIWSIVNNLTIVIVYGARGLIITVIINVIITVIITVIDTLFLLIDIVHRGLIEQKTNAVI